MTPQQIIDQLGLIPKPVEGGMIRRTYCSTDWIAQAHLPSRYSSDKPFDSPPLECC
jgi:hypothetical protein